jgi:RimJ/RimL family protein N-acetyltransferase
MDHNHDSLLQEMPPRGRWSRYLTARLTLRPITAEDFGLLRAIFTDPRTTAHRPDPRPETEAECLQRLARYLNQWEANGFGIWILEHEGISVGMGGLTHRDGFSGLNLSYHLLPDQWGHGFASEFAAAAVDIALRDMGASRVIGVIRHVNRASRRVVEKAGLTLEREIIFGDHPGLLYVKHREPLPR